MKKRFNSKSNYSYDKLLVIIFVTTTLVIFIYSLNRVSENTLLKQRESLENAINKSIVACYASEGYYPENIEYILENYGIQYDKNKFYINYLSFASNRRPDIDVIVVGE
ncbi:MAG: hypothetical protein WBO70_01170 [Erysipelotrichaceae bacterium]